MDADFEISTGHAHLSECDIVLKPAVGIDPCIDVETGKQFRDSRLDARVRRVIAELLVEAFIARRTIRGEIHSGRNRCGKGRAAELDERNSVTCVAYGPN